MPYFTKNQNTKNIHFFILHGIVCTAEILWTQEFVWLPYWRKYLSQLSASGGHFWGSALVRGTIGWDGLGRVVGRVRMD